MLAKLFNERLSLVLVVVVAGLATALITGSSLTAVIIASAVVLLLGALTLGKGSEASSEQNNGSSQRAGEPFSFCYAWTTERQMDDLGVIVKQLSSLGLRPDVAANSVSSVVLRGGSQIQTRLLGGYFVDPKKLPIRVDLGISPKGENGQRALELTVQDTLGVAIRDKGLEERYARAACNIKRMVEGIYPDG